MSTTEVQYACEYPEFFQSDSPMRARPEKSREEAEAILPYLTRRHKEFGILYPDVEMPPAPRIVKRTVTYSDWEEA